MVEETFDEVSGQEVFDEAVDKTPKEPVAEAKVEKEQPEAKADEKPERERDEKGRFVSRDAKEEEAPEEAAPAKEEKPEFHIPSWRLKEEADAKREALARAEQAERQAQQFQMQMAELHRQLQAMQQPQEPIDIFADPNAYQASIQQAMDQRLKAMEGNFSLRLAAYKHGELFHKAWADMTSRSQMGDDSMRQQVLQSPDPGETLVQLYQREQVVKEVGTDPLAYRNKILEDALNDPDYLAKALEKARGVAGTQPTQTISMPKSLNQVAAANVRGEPEGDAGIWSYVNSR